MKLKIAISIKIFKVTVEDKVIKFLKINYLNFT